jgi:acetylornithine/N-succinyldiaminopimelate aminotransferase
MNFENVKAKDEKYLLHTYGRVPVAIESGKGVIAKDTDGKEYIDFTAGIGVNVLGYSNDSWVKAVTEQLNKVQHICNYYYSPVTNELAEKLCKAAQMSRVFFCNSGAEANECAIKVARKYGEKKKAFKIITLENSFHGRTITTLSATGQDAFHEIFKPMTEGFIYAPANDAEALKNMITDDVCAVMIEGVQGEGGVVPMDDEYIRELRKICDDRDILLIMDEVQTGVGRTGYFYSYQSTGILPDVVTSAKGLAGGLPIGACLVNGKLEDIFTPGMNGSTFGANPVVCAGAVEVVKTVSDSSFLQKVREKGDYIVSKLLEMPNVELVRGKGMMIGVKVKNHDAHDIMSKCAENGLLVLTAKELVRFLPPLIITEDEIDKGLEIFKKVIE